MNQDDHESAHRELSELADRELSELAELMNTERELTDEERDRLYRVAEAGWASLRPVANAILLERRRIRDLWLRVEAAGERDYYEDLTRFRAALGLS
jgi:DNA-binding PadR family transcriptional regulator